MAIEDLDSGDPERASYALEWLATGPRPADYARFAWSAFQDLTSERPMVVTMAAPIMGPIPVTKILEYARHYGLDDHETSDLKTIVRLLDAHDRSRIKK